MIITDITGIGDPFILVHNGTYYMYATNAADGFRFYTSKDLKNWTDGGYCYKNSPWGECDFWAPEVYERGEKFYLIYTARWKKNHSLRIGIAVADSPEGEFKDLTDGPLFDYGYAAIDATLFQDEDGKEYFYFVRDCSENVIDGVHTSVIYCSEISKDYTRLIGEPKEISKPEFAWEKHSGPEWLWNEGPVLWKHNGKYYLNFSTNFYASREYAVGCSESQSPWGPFVKYDGPILSYKKNEYSGPGHNSLFTGLDGKMYMPFHIHTDYNAPSGNRRACITEVYFDEEDKMKVRL